LKFRAHAVLFSQGRKGVLFFLLKNNFESFLRRVHGHAEKVVTPWKVHRSEVYQHVKKINQIVPPRCRVHTHLLHAGELGITREKLQTTHRGMLAGFWILIGLAALK
jgi:hypothetical protein